MTVGDYASGAASVLAFGAGAWIAAAMARRAFLSGVSGALAYLAQLVMAISAMVLVTEVLGTAGWLGRWQLLVAMGLVVVLVGTVTGRRRDSSSGRRADGSLWAALVALVVAGVVGQWVAGSAVGLHSGPTAVDTLRYHLPLTGRFIQGHSLSQLQYLDQDLLPTYDPLNAEMLHVDAGTLFGSDQFSAVVNLMWLALALLAAGALGQRMRHVRLQLMLATAVVLSVPVLVVTNSGSAADDLATLALLLAAVVFVVVARTAGGDWSADASSQTAPGWLALVTMGGTAAGLAIGTKFYALAPAGVLFVTVVWLWRRSWGVAVPAWLVPAVATGSYWYARNWVDAGNPVPESALHIGPLHLAAVHDPVRELTGYSVAHYLTDATFWRHVVKPGLSLALGPAWWAILVGSAAGVVVALVRGPATARIVASIATVAAAAYLFTPYSAGGPPGDQYLFAPDVRFLLPALLLGLLSGIMATSDLRVPSLILSGALALTVLATWLAASGAYQAWPASEVGYGVLAALVVAVVLVAGDRQLRFSARQWRSLVAATLIACVVVGGFFAARGYPLRRYATNPIARWAAGLNGVRIGEIGYPMLYPLFGNDFANDVVYLERPDGSGNLVPNLTCTSWARTLQIYRPAFVVVGDNTLFPPGTPEVAWTEAVTRAHVVFSSAGTTVLRIGSAVSSSGCANL